MKRFTRKATISLGILATVGLLLWQFSPVSAVLAVAHLSDPAKLATLSQRGANAHLNKLVYWLHEARTRGVPAGITIQLAQQINRTRQPRASLVRESLLRNLQIAQDLGLFTRDNLDRLRKRERIT